MHKGILHHIEFNVSNLTRSLEFWGWLLPRLGYEPFQRWDKGKSWKKGETYIVFVQVEESYADIPFHRKRVGLNHIAFHVESREQLESLIQELRVRNIPVLYSDRYPRDDWYAVYFEDPDRVKVEVIAL